MSKSQIFAWLFALGGASLAMLALKLKSIDAKQMRWSRVSGLVEVSNVAFLWETFRADIKYRYKVGETEYVGDVVRSRTLQFNWRGPAARLCKRYPQGATVIVFVDPADPRSSVLEPGGDEATIRMIWLFATALFLFGAIAAAR
ncbi:MAG: DUF3592 domain-containing protein [Nitrospira sp.]